MISKELLSEVLGEDFEILSIKEHFVKIRHLEAYTSVEWCIHKVAHECKEWAITKGWILHEVRNLKEYIVYFSGDCRNPSDDFRCDTEPEAIFKACQWILDNKEK